MKQRIITGIILAAMFIPVLFLSGTVVFNIVIALLSAIGVYEILACTGRKHPAISVPAIIYAISGPLLARTRFASAYGVLLGVTIIFLFYLVFIHVFRSDKISTEDISVVFMTSVYVTVAFTSIIRIRDIENIGHYLYILIFIGAWVTDTAAYFCGRFFGKHKLLPKISPKKTVEGSIGGIVFCSAFFVLYISIIAQRANITPNYLFVAVLGAFISVISQLGDLAASAIKRDYDIKDYGNIFPGHGGVLDRFDSIIAVSPFLFILLSNPNVFNFFGIA